MDYTGLYWAELLPIIISIMAIIGILIAGVHDYIKSELDVSAAIILGVLSALPGSIAFSCGLGRSNLEDDFKCKCFIQHCDKDLLEVEKSWPNLTVTYDGEEVFSKGVRRQSLLYLQSLQEDKVDNSKQKIDDIVNKVIEKGMHVRAN